MSSLVFGAFFPVFQDAQASFGSFLFGTPASADSVSQDDSGLADSQDIYLSTPDSALAFANKDNSDGDEDSDSDVVISNNALSPAVTPASLNSDSDQDSSSDDQTSVYVVREGDTWSGIASMYQVTVNTILYANDMKKGDTLKVGAELVIPPVSGLEYTVKSGQTCQSIAKAYGADASDIIDYNNLGPDCELSAGDQLFIPGADQSPESDTPVKDLSASIAKDNQYYQSHPIQNLSGYYIDPVPGYRLSQGIHDNNAVDLAIASGTPIHAAASGIVLIARDGYNGGFGNYVVINHPNGTQTLYAHQSRLAVSAGDHVTQGQVIGYVGMTGHATGPHLHFEVHGARNPGADDSWAH